MSDHNNGNDNKLLVQIHKLNDSPYQDVWDFQTILHNKIKQTKRTRKHVSSDREYIGDLINHIVFCEHLPVYTLGKSADISNLLLEEADLNDQGFEVFKVNRGGDITYHGPGQLTGYYILDVESIARDVHKYVRSLEQIVIDLLQTYGVEGMRLDAFTGVWVKVSHKYRKVCAIGVHLSRWVSMHGFGLNVNTQLDHFNNIVPCGIADKDKEVTSLSELVGNKLDIEEVRTRLVDISCNTFGLSKVH